KRIGMCIRFVDNERRSNKRCFNWERLCRFDSFAPINFQSERRGSVDGLFDEQEMLEKSFSPNLNLQIKPMLSELRFGRELLVAVQAEGIIRRRMGVQRAGNFLQPVAVTPQVA